MLTPLPRIAELGGWLGEYLNGKYRDGAVEEQAFCIYLDPTDGQIHVVDPWQISEPTVTFYIGDEAAKIVAARVESVHSAWLKGWPIRMDGDFALRDAALVDEILQQYYELMKDHGHDLIALFKET